MQINVWKPFRCLCLPPREVCEFLDTVASGTWLATVLRCSHDAEEDLGQALVEGEVPAGRRAC